MEDYYLIYTDMDNSLVELRLQPTMFQCQQSNCFASSPHRPRNELRVPESRAETFDVDLEVAWPLWIY